MNRCHNGVMTHVKQIKSTAIGVHHSAHWLSLASLPSPLMSSVICVTFLLQSHCGQRF